mgnify:CR=1 FL=1
MFQVFSHGKKNGRSVNEMQGDQEETANDLNNFKRLALKEAEHREDELWVHFFKSVPKIPLIELQRMLHDFESKIFALTDRAELDKWIAKLREGAVPPFALEKQLPLEWNKTRRAGLYLAPSKLTTGKGQPIRQYGLFTNKKIKSGEFIMFYNGVFYEAEEWCELDEDERNALAEYRIRNERRLSIASPMRSFNQTENLMTYPAAAINEPTKDLQANIFVVETKIADDRRDGTTHECFVIFACADIRANQELLYHYGTGFEEEYETGTECDDRAISNNSTRDQEIRRIVLLISMENYASAEAQQRARQILGDQKNEVIHTRTGAHNSNFAKDYAPCEDR